MAALKCPYGTTISQVVFASYGTPTGTCGSFAQGVCHQANTKELVEDLCVGENECRISASAHLFGEPCPVVEKNFRVQVECAGSSVLLLYRHHLLAAGAPSCSRPLQTFSLSV